MAIVISTPLEGKRHIELDNGHVKALQKIVQDYSLLGEHQALEFILSLISEADGNAINNGKGSYLPSDKLKKPQ